MLPTEMLPTETNPIESTTEESAVEPAEQLPAIPPNLSGDGPGFWSTLGTLLWRHKHLVLPLAAAIIALSNT